MAAKDPEMRRLAVRAGGLARLGDREELDRVRVQLAMLRIKHNISQVLADAPELTGEQLSELSDFILAGGRIQ